jgi:putative ABC transport system permease protein
MAYSVGQRTAEIGIRVTLGAKPVDTMRLVLREGLGLAFTGLVVGAAAAVALANTLRAVLVSVSPADPAVFAGAAGLIVAIALLSSVIPAWRALRVSPTVALRSE